MNHPTYHKYSLGSNVITTLRDIQNTREGDNLLIVIVIHFRCNQFDSNLPTTTTIKVSSLYRVSNKTKPHHENKNKNHEYFSIVFSSTIKSGLSVLKQAQAHSLCCTHNICCDDDNGGWISLLMGHVNS